MAWSFWKDKRPEWVQAEERDFIKAANGLKTLQVTPRGGMRIDPEEIRDQIVSARELYKGLVKKWFFTESRETQKQERRFDG